jgi:hypothetical protein
VAASISESDRAVAPYDGGDALALDARPADATIMPDAPTPDAPRQPIAFVQINNTEGQNLMSVDVPLVQAQAAGDLNVVAIGWFKTGSVPHA